MNGVPTFSLIPGSKEHFYATSILFPPVPFSILGYISTPLFPSLNLVLVESSSSFCSCCRRWLKVIPAADGYLRKASVYTSRVARTIFLTCANCHIQ
jgi:hypothetical protein